MEPVNSAWFVGVFYSMAGGWVVLHDLSCAAVAVDVDLEVDDISGFGDSEVVLLVSYVDAILQNARLCFVDKPKLENKQQSKFEKMLGMEYFCPGIGNVRLMVGVRRRDKTKIQYCITALTPVLGVKDEEKSSHK